jgi:hypothetical protein
MQHVLALALLDVAAAYSPPANFTFAGMFPRAGWNVGHICQAAAELVSNGSGFFTCNLTLAFLAGHR